jgi:ABC-type sugar transport system permease subunit
LKTVLVFTILLRLIANFGNVEIIMGMTAGGPAGATLTVMAYVMLSFRGGEAAITNYGTLAAFGVVIWLFMLACSLIYLWLSKVSKDKDA